jgi:hypothetical protein
MTGTVSLNRMSWIQASRALPPIDKLVEVQGIMTKYSQPVPGIEHGEARRYDNYRGDHYWQDASDPQAFWNVTLWKAKQ